MRVVFLIIVFLHALIHLLGFVQAFNLAEVRELTLPISKTAGILWLLAAVAFGVYGIMYLSHNSKAWMFGLAAIIISQVLIVSFWQDAKFATLPNLIILIAVAFSFGNFRFNQMIEWEKAEILSEAHVQTPEIFSEAEIEHLPKAVQTWLKNSGAVGREKTLNGKIVQKAGMKMKPEQENWSKATAVQYTVISNPSFLWTVDLKMNKFLWVKGRDKFVDGKGQMLIKMNSLVNVVNAEGEKVDEGSLQRFLGEMVWFPALAVSPYVSWEELDDLCARATLKYKNTEGSGTFYFDEKGNFLKFTALRFQGNEPDSKRKEWILTVDGYKVFEGIKVPSKMTATWKLEKENWTWLKLEILDINYNVNNQTNASS